MTSTGQKSTSPDNLDSSADNSGPNWAKWEKIPKAELWKVVALSLNIRPSQLLNELNHRFDPLDPLRSMPPRFRERLEIAEANLGEGLPEVEHRETKDFGGNRRPYLSIVRLTDFCSWADQMGLDLPHDFPEPAPAPDWEAYKGRRSLTLHEAVALSLNIQLDFSYFPQGAPSEGTAPASVSAFNRRVAIVYGHFDDGTLEVRQKVDPDADAMGLPPTWHINVDSFRELAATKGWDLPPEFPGTPSQGSTNSRVSLPGAVKAKTPANGTNVHLPHTTTTLDRLFEVMREVWTDYDPKNPPKQTSIAERIDEVLEWEPQTDGQPSRRAQTLAAAIRPDPLAEADVRRTLRHRRGKS